MKITPMLLIVFTIILAACTAPATSAPLPTVTRIETTAAVPSPEAALAPTQSLAPTQAASMVQYNGSPLALARNDWFSGAGNCTSCHNSMLDEAGSDVSIDRMWRASMMANAARDPYWQATVRSEALEHPELRGVIETKCATCHMPMAEFSAALAGEDALILDDGFLDPGHTLHPLALDGVSCNLCHQVRPDNFGAQESFSGAYVIDDQLPVGEREAFGPFEVPPGLAQIMSSVSGFVPLQGPHIEQSEMCATCHVLYTPYLDKNGQIAGEFPEQTVYLEWQNSSHAQNTPCQTCHMPTAQGGVQLSVTGGPKRSPFYQHDFSGGNAYMLNLMLVNGETLGVTAASEHFQSSINLAREMIEARTVALELDSLRLEGANLLGEVRLQSQVGHKFPTSFPSRRAWLHITVLDASGQVVFESGAYAPDGSIRGNDNDADPTQFEPHYSQLSSPDQVQIYEAIMADTLGQVTTKLLYAASYVKDNRLLPAGFDQAGASGDIAVRGEATQDADFQAGGDRLQLALDLGSAQGPFTVQVELLYQSIGFRWADNFRQYDAPEITRFLDFYQATPNLPLLVDQAEAQVGP